MKKYIAPAIEFDELLADSRIANNDDLDLLDDDEVGIDPDVSGWGGYALD